jgi:nucleotide-binding universal stress UspA family protein
MYRAILVPLDGSLLSEQALPTAYDIARRSGAALHLVHVHMLNDTIHVEGMPVIDTELHSLGREHERVYLEHIRAGLASRSDIAITCADLDHEGSVAAALARYVVTAGIDLVVMTSHGRSGFERLWLGSVADSLVRLSTAPILLLRSAESVPDIAQPPVARRILIPLDGSTQAEHILRPAVTLGRTIQAELTLLQVVTPAAQHDAFAVAASNADSDVQVAQRHARAEAYLARTAQRLEADGMQTHTRVIVAPQPAVAILEDAALHQSDLIAMTTHARSGFERLLVGSVADKVLRGATTPLLLYRPQDR